MENSLKLSFAILGSIFGDVRKYKTVKNFFSPWFDLYISLVRFTCRQVLVQAIPAHCCMFLLDLLFQLGLWLEINLIFCLPISGWIFWILQCYYFHCWCRQQIRIQQLSDENSSLQERLKTADDTIERQMKQIENLTLQLGEAERTLAEKEEDMDSLDKASKDEVHMLSLYFR